MRWTIAHRGLATLVTLSVVLAGPLAQPSVAKVAEPLSEKSENVVLEWNNAVLDAVRAGTLGPPMVARALGIVHTCMYDAWAAYDPRALGTRYGDELRRPAPERSLVNKKEAVSYAAYLATVDLFPASKPRFDALMNTLGYDLPAQSGTSTTPANVGITACRAVLDFRHSDGSNQLGDLHPGPYSDYTGYQPVNEPMVVDGPLDPATVRNPSHWQPLTYVNRAGHLDTPGFLGAHWRQVTPFAYKPGAGVPGLTGFAAYGTAEFVRQHAELVDISANLTDRQKAIAEFWADGPRSEQPPGHWMLFGQFISQRDRHGLDEDVKMFFALANAVMDAGIAIWGLKRVGDAVRPITAIRYLYQGQQISAWGGPGQGTKTIDGGTWRPYQASWFPTPPFAEWPSGHSAFSAAGAEILERFTHRKHFGASYTVAAGSSRVEPNTPSTDVTLYWDTFLEAADEAGFSRRYGGIHPESGDLDGRRIGHFVGGQAWEQAELLWTGKAAK
jgi:Domain of unknown function (DUF6851)/VCPO second helical-bundle domain